MSLVVRSDGRGAENVKNHIARYFWGNSCVGGICSLIVQRLISENK